jgi:CDP-L-myo-inositol myo-inositolphosphotransferase
MKYGTVGSRGVVRFRTAHEAQRPVAGVGVAARILRELDRAGFTEVWIELPAGDPTDPLDLHEIHRVAPGLTVHQGTLPDHLTAVRFPSDRVISAEAVPEFIAGLPYPFVQVDGPDAANNILRHAGKAGDGFVSRWINRPISRQFSAILLRVPGVRPIHATIGTAAIALAMSIALLFGGKPGLLIGALLFQVASIFDGVDGEIARATFRTSPSGAALDSAIDAATNFAAMLGLAVNLALRGEREALDLATWGLALLLIGWTMIGRRSLRETGSVSFDGVKHRYRGRPAGPMATRLMALATMGTSRDFCALVYLLLVLAGIPIAGLYLLAVVTPVWILFVIAALWPSRRQAPAATEGAA